MIWAAARGPAKHPDRCKAKIVGISTFKPGAPGTARIKTTFPDGREFWLDFSEHDFRLLRQEVYRLGGRRPGQAEERRTEVAREMQPDGSVHDVDPADM